MRSPDTVLEPVAQQSPLQPSPLFNAGYNVPDSGQVKQNGNPSGEVPVGQGPLSPEAPSGTTSATSGPVELPGTPKPAPQDAPAASPAGSGDTLPAPATDDSGSNHSSSMGNAVLGLGGASLLALGGYKFREPIMNNVRKLPFPFLHRTDAAATQHEAPAGGPQSETPVAAIKPEVALAEHEQPHFETPIVDNIVAEHTPVQPNERYAGKLTGVIPADLNSSLDHEINPEVVRSDDARLVGYRTYDGAVHMTSLGDHSPITLSTRSDGKLTVRDGESIVDPSDAEKFNALVHQAQASAYSMPELAEGAAAAQDSSSIINQVLRAAEQIHRI